MGVVVAMASGGERMARARRGAREGGVGEVGSRAHLVSGCSSRWWRKRRGSAGPGSPAAPELRTGGSAPSPPRPCWRAPPLGTSGAAEGQNRGGGGQGDGVPQKRCAVTTVILLRYGRKVSTVQSRTTVERLCNNTCYCTIAFDTKQS